MVQFLFLGVNSILRHLNETPFRFPIVPIPILQIELTISTQKLTLHLIYTYIVYHLPYSLFQTIFTLFNDGSGRYDVTIKPLPFPKEDKLPEHTLTLAANPILDGALQITRTSFSSELSISTVGIVNNNAVT